MTSTRVFLSPMLLEVWKDVEKPSSVEIFDTTLRDGEQTPGTSFKTEEKVKIAESLDRLGVSVIEAGFPANSPEEERAVKEVASVGLRAKLCGLARCVRGDIDACVRADVDRVHVFIATSDIHLKYKLKMDAEEALERAVASIEYVKSHGLECEFSCEDATRTPYDRLVKFYTEAVEAGADVLNVPDTVGAVDPWGMYELVRRLKRDVGAPISVHCHNDFGLAVANTVAGVLAGASQAHVTVNGLGERAGNAALEQVVAVLELMHGVKTGVNMGMLMEVSRLVQKYSLIQVPPNFPIVGENAFSHEAGIHVHGILEAAPCYEPFPPEVVGQERKIVLGKHTGRHAVKAFIETRLGKLPEDLMDEIVMRVKEVGVRKKRMLEEDVLAIAEDVIERRMEREKHVRLEEIVVVTGNKVTPTASVQLRVGDTVKVAAGIGVGPVDAAAKAIQSALNEEISLLKYDLKAVSGGADALAYVEVLVEDLTGERAKGSAVTGDIVMSSVEAIVEGVNRLYVRRLRRGG